MRHPLTLICPYPNIDEEGNLRDGYTMSQPRFCNEKCKDRPCKNYGDHLGSGEIAFLTCPYGFSVALARVANHIFRVNGVIETVSNQASASFKKQQKDQKLKRPEFERWVAMLDEASPIYENMLEQIAVEAIRNYLKSRKRQSRRYQMRMQASWIDAR